MSYQTYRTDDARHTSTRVCKRSQCPTRKVSAGLGAGIVSIIALYAAGAYGLEFTAIDGASMTLAMVFGVQYFIRS